MDFCTVSVLLLNYQDIKGSFWTCFQSYGHKDRVTLKLCSASGFMKLRHIFISFEHYDYPHGIGSVGDNPTAYRWRNWTETSYPRWSNYWVVVESIWSLSPLPNCANFILPYSPWSWVFSYLIALNYRLIEKTYLIFFSAYTLRNNSLRNDLVLLVISLISISEP